MRSTDSLEFEGRRMESEERDAEEEEDLEREEDDEGFEEASSEGPSQQNKKLVRNTNFWPLQCIQSGSKV